MQLDSSVRQTAPHLESKENYLSRAEASMLSVEPKEATLANGMA